MADEEAILLVHEPVGDGQHNVVGEAVGAPPRERLLPVESLTALEEPEQEHTVEEIVQRAEPLQDSAVQRKLGFFVARITHVA